MVRAGRAAPSVNSMRTLKPLPRKIWVFTHVAVSVGWFGGGYAMLVMAIVAMTDAGTPLRPAAYELMRISDNAIMIPGSLGALITGLVVGLGTRWRVLRHWWVVTKLLLTIGGMAFAYLYIAQRVETALDMALRIGPTEPHTDIAPLAPGIVAGSSLMLVVLLTTTWLSVRKPWGRTPARGCGPRASISTGR